MDLGTNLIIALGLSMDAFAVSLGAGTNQGVNVLRSRLRLAFHFGIFQALMPVIGWYLGLRVEPYIRAFDHWIAMGLLSYVGINMVRSGLNPDSEIFPQDPSRGKTMVLLSVATSIDALAVGLSLAMLQVPIYIPAAIIGIVTFGLSIAGLLLGGQLGQRFGKRMEILGGIVLIGIGLRVLLSHL
jgi:manganese efflux pump family protein